MASETANRWLGRPRRTLHYGDVSKRTVILVNPKAGSGRAGERAQAARERLASAGWPVEVIETERAGHAVDIVRDADDVRAWVGVGGDGTLHEVVAGLMTHDEGARACLALVPAGGGNALAHDLGLHNPLGSVDGLIAGHLEPLDIMRIDDADGRRHHAFNVVGYGMAADVARRAERWRRLGSARYTWASLVDVARRSVHDAALLVDDEVIEGPFLFAIACNTIHTGTGMKMAPEARFGDGEFDLVAVRPMGRLAMTKLLQRVFDGAHVSDERVIVRRARRVRIESRTPEILAVDGEIEGSSPTEITVLPAALQLATPS